MLRVLSLFTPLALTVAVFSEAIYTPIVTNKREFQVAVAAGFNNILSSDNFLKPNSGAEIGLLLTLPLQIWREDASIVAVRGQFTSFSNGIDSLATDGTGNTLKLVNASHAQLRTDFRQIFRHWGVDWSIGLGVQIPITSRILTPRGELNFSDARTYYADSASSLDKIASTYAGYLRLGIDQKLLGDALCVGVAFEINFVESPQSLQRTAINLYAGARIW